MLRTDRPVWAASSSMVSRLGDTEPSACSRLAVATSRRLGLAAPSGDGDLAGPGHLHQPEGPHQLLERLDLVAGAGDLDDQRAAAHVHDGGPEDLTDLHHLGPA